MARVRPFMLCQAGLAIFLSGALAGIHLDRLAHPRPEAPRRDAPTVVASAPRVWPAPLPPPVYQYHGSARGAAFDFETADGRDIWARRHAAGLGCLTPWGLIECTTPDHKTD